MFYKHLAQFSYCVQIIKGFSINSFQKMLQVIAALSLNCRLFAHRYPAHFQNLLQPSIQFKTEHGLREQQQPTSHRFISL